MNLQARRADFAVVLASSLLFGPVAKADIFHAEIDADGSNLRALVAGGGGRVEDFETLDEPVPAHAEVTATLGASTAHATADIDITASMFRLRSLGSFDRNGSCCGGHTRFNGKLSFTLDQIAPVSIDGTLASNAPPELAPSFRMFRDDDGIPVEELYVQSDFHSAGSLRAGRYTVFALAYAPNSFGTTWHGFHNYDVTLTIEPSYLLADANDDGVISVADVGLLATNFGQTTEGGRSLGDFNYDGTVSIADVGILATYFGEGERAPRSPSFAEAIQAYPNLVAAVPEPSAAAAAGALITMVALGFRFRRR